ncbi:MAG TPA: type II toxin-antitoxin system RelE/ParE family toxin [Candidatus Rothia avicola]|uniref:Type II toxin-antitoxin system RelE/ParE family toxin n=1 Tax=Candidatus Rothia avicola TaxID=2840478 RepID=A0A9D1ZPH9_9MICC|nr:type II toxin-antitoxin system RelE/ParE family toxin [Candidatus Rothia avicola]
MWSIDVALIEHWVKELDSDSRGQLFAALELLQEYGPHLGRPLVDTVSNSKHRNMKELRPGSAGRSELRVLFAFDIERRAIMLIAGDKAGNWQPWYKKSIPIADRLFGEHQDRLGGK